MEADGVVGEVPRDIESQFNGVVQAIVYRPVEFTGIVFFFDCDASFDLDERCLGGT